MFTKYLSTAAVIILLLGLSVRANALETYTRNSAVVCQPDGNHADFDFTMAGALVNTSTGTRTVICAVPSRTGLEPNYRVEVGFINGAQGTNCTMRAVADGGSTLMSTSGTWFGGNGGLYLTLSGYRAVYKQVQVRCALVAGGGVLMIDVVTGE